MKKFIFMSLLIFGFVFQIKSDTKIFNDTPYTLKINSSSQGRVFVDSGRALKVWNDESVNIAIATDEDYN